MPLWQQLEWTPSKGKFQASYVARIQNFEYISRTKQSILASAASSQKRPEDNVLKEP